MKVFLILLCLTSCSLFRNPEEEKVLASWKGKKVEDLEKHPFFSQVPLKKKDDRTIIYEEPGKYRSRASCIGMGGCMGLSSGSCQNVFKIKKGIIRKYEMRESCLNNPKKMALP